MNTQAPTLSPSSANTGWLYALQYKHATVLTAITFVIVGVTGVMVFFHLGTQYVMGMHEWLGLVMVAAAALHMTRHMKALGKQLQKPRARVWLATGALVTAVFVGSALLAPSGGNPMKAYAHKSIDASVSAIGAVLNVSDSDVQARLEAAGLDANDLNMSVNDVAAFNHVEAPAVLAAVMGPR
ncbi:DUF4405 domain-containing protein [Magnetovibrio sp. PR-2]|uniref:DUF4405 domain-containing protein n=1 Tax=Magnetovibrio sp. PR-2 TaxID=3120356 RepID=UPI002FCE3774